MTRFLRLAGVAALSAATCAQSPPMEDVLWTSDGRSLVATDRFGRIERRVDVAGGLFGALHRAPDGTLWSFAQQPRGVERRDAQGNHLATFPSASAGIPTALTFDAAGDAWIADFNVAPFRSLIGRHAPDGTLRQSYTLPGPALDVEVGARGLIWVLCTDRNQPAITLIDPSATTARTIRLPFPALTVAQELETTPQGTAFVATEHRITEFDSDGAVRRVLRGVPGVAQQIALRASADLIVLAESGSLYRVDLATGSATLAYRRLDPRPASMSLDPLGGVWASWPSPAPLLHRIDLEQNRTDISVAVSSMHLRMDDSSGYHRALVVAPGADDDGDSTPNGVELQLGTNPYDGQSSPLASLRTDRVTYRPFDRLAISVRGVGGEGLVLIALGTRYDQPGLPGFVGVLRLDPGPMVPEVLRTVVPGEIVYSVPDEPSLHGLRLYAQAVVGFVLPRFTNELGIQVDTSGSR